jgi:hypothetical protein
MADSWEIATVALTICIVLVAILVIPIFMTERGSRFLKKLRDRFYRINTDAGHCKKLLWSDIHALHKCAAPPSCQHPAHTAGSVCWEDTLGRVFGFDGTSLPRVPKPWELDATKSFLRTDVHTIIAFVLCSVGPRVRQCNVNETQLQFDEVDVRLDDRNGVLVAHISSTTQPTPHNLTKDAVMRITSGYPPFYREQIDLGSVGTVPFPIKDERDIKRGGWVIAVGLMAESRPGSGVLQEAPLGLFIDEDGSEHAFPNYRPFEKGIRRVHDVINTLFVAAFSDEPNLNSTITLLDHVTRRSQRSITSLDLSELARLSSKLKEGGETMSKEQCETVMDVFNSSSPLDSDKVEALRPILLVVLGVALEGVRRVILYSWDAKRLILPQSLRDRNRAVYLRGCENADSN